MEQKFLLGVYDHLRRGGEANYTYMSGATYLGTYYTEPDYDLYHLSSEYPGLRCEGSTSILLEIFEVTDEILKTTDFYEGTNPFAPHQNIFNRIEIDTPYGPCFIYEYSKALVSKPKIETGDWFKYRKSLRQRILDLNDNEDSRWGME